LNFAKGFGTAPWLLSPGKQSHQHRFINLVTDISAGFAIEDTEKSKSVTSHQNSPNSVKKGFFSASIRF